MKDWVDIVLWAVVAAAVAGMAGYAIYGNMRKSKRRISGAGMVEVITEKYAEPPEQTVREDDGTDGELIAVLAAAVAAYEGSKPSSFVIRSYRRAGNSGWIAAARSVRAGESR